MRALGIDPATVTGFAHGELGRRPIGGTIGLTGHRGLRYNTLMGRVRQLIQDNEIDMVYVESSYITLYARKSGLHCAAQSPAPGAALCQLCQNADRER